MSAHRKKFAKFATSCWSSTPKTDKKTGQKIPPKKRFGLVAACVKQKFAEDKKGK